MADLSEVNGRALPELHDLLRSALSEFGKLHPQYEVSLYDRTTISDQDLDSCFDLVKVNLQSAYENSSWGWKPDFKREELQEPDTKYFLVRAAGQPRDGPSAFLSCQMVDENGEIVIYCYELQIKEEIRHQGIGRSLMRLMHQLGRANRIQRSMLTVFRANQRATTFYEKLGYVIDKTNPKDLLLRGRVVQADYMILTMPL